MGGGRFCLVASQTWPFCDLYCSSQGKKWKVFDVKFCGSWTSGVFSQRHRKAREDKSLPLTLPSALHCPYLLSNSPWSFDFYQTYLAPLIPVLRGFDSNASVVGPPGYEILLRQTWCYVILRNWGGSSAGSWSGARKEKLYGSAYGMNSLAGSTHSWIPGP